MILYRNGHERIIKDVLTKNISDDKDSDFSEKPQKLKRYVLRSRFRSVIESKDLGKRNKKGSKV